MLPHNYAQTTAEGAYIHARARAIYYTHTRTLYLYTRKGAVAHAQTCTCYIYNSYGNTIQPALRAPGFALPPPPLNAPFPN